MCGWTVNFMNHGKLCTHHHLASSCVECIRDVRQIGHVICSFVRHKYIVTHRRAFTELSSFTIISRRRPSPLPHFALSQCRAPPRKCTLTLPPRAPSLPSFVSVLPGISWYLCLCRCLCAACWCLRVRVRRTPRPPRCVSTGPDDLSVVVRLARSSQVYT